MVEASPSKVELPWLRHVLTALDVAALALLGTFALIVLGIGAGIDAWRHDSLYYVGDFGPKAMSNGRWLAYLLWPPVVRLPGFVNWTLCYVFLGGFAYRVARLHAQDVRTSAMFALLICQIPSVLGQNLWPAGTLPGPLLLLAAALTAKRLPLPIFYAGFGVLFFGVSQHYYFLLPLLHLPQMWKAPKGALRATAVLLGLWLLGFAAGALAAQGIVYGVFGFERELEVPAWREPNLVTDWSSFVENLTSRGRLIAEHVGILSEISLGTLPILLMAGLRSVSQSRKELLVSGAVCLVVGLAIYAATLPIGITVDFRTALPLYVAILGFAFLGAGSTAHRALYPVATMLVCIPFVQVNVHNLQWFRSVNEAYRDELLRVVPQPPETYSGVMVVAGTAQVFQRQIEAQTGKRARYIVPHLSVREGRDLRWRPAAFAAGFQRVRFCPAEGCPPLETETCDRRRPYCLHGVGPDGSLLLSFSRRLPPRPRASPPAARPSPGERSPPG